MSAVLEEVCWNVGVSLFCIPGVVRGGILLYSWWWHAAEEMKTAKKERSKPVVFDRWGDGEGQEADCEQMATKGLFGMEGKGSGPAIKESGTAAWMEQAQSWEAKCCVWDAPVCGPVRRDLSWSFSAWTPCFKNLRVFQENPKERGWVWPGICNTHVWVQAGRHCVGLCLCEGCGWWALLLEEREMQLVLGCVCCGEEEQSWI